MLAAGVGAAAVVALILGVVVGRVTLGAVHDRHVRATLAEATGGEARVGRVGLRWSGLVLQDVAVEGPDGHVVARIDRVHMRGAGPGFHVGLSPLREVELDGLEVDLRRRDGAWVVPPKTVALLTDGGGQAREGTRGVDLIVGPSRLTARDAGGTLRARLDGARVDALARTPEGWSATGWSARGIAVDVNLPVLEVARVSLGPDREARIQGLELWLHTREDGWLDWPPVVEDGVPVWMGGRAGDGGSWLEDAAGASPAPLDAFVVESGTVRLLDDAHAPDEVEWALWIDQGSARREPDDSWRLTALGAVDDARASLDGALAGDGTLEGRLEVRELDLLHLHPYLAGGLAEEGVALESGRLDAVIGIEERGADIGWLAAMQIDRPVLVPLSGQPEDLTRRQRRLLESRDAVEVEVEDTGRMDDADFHPVDDLAGATVAALLDPVRPRGFLRRRAPRSEAPTPAPGAGTPPPPVEDEGGEVVEIDEMPPDLRERWRRQRRKAREALEALRERVERR